MTTSKPSITPKRTKTAIPWKKPGKWSGPPGVRPAVGCLTTSTMCWVLASWSLPREKTDSLEPWDLENLTPYQDEYLSGFQAEAYQVNLAQGFEQAKKKMGAIIEDTIETDIGGDHQRIHSVSTEYNNLTFKHILLPIWINAYRYQGKSFRFVVNARTGEVQGERPWSYLKIAMAAVGALAAGGLIYWLIRTFGS